ncbi:unnamed protein product [Symbiodinium sp. CCMP2592]|nr:unnamed protein product [Symbiodinium sp. CCMP2592]
MPWLDVYALDKQLCRIKTEPGWTGRELKEAIEEATAWDFLVCTQQLAVGTTLITHDVQLDTVLTGDADASMTRLPEPANIQAFSGDRKALGMAMRPLEMFPIVAMELPMHEVLFDASTWQQWDGMEAACKEAYRSCREDEPPEVLPSHRKLTAEMLSNPAWFPWEYLVNIPHSDVAAVLALQASADMIGDGGSWLAAVLLLQDGELLATTVCVDEACHVIQYSSMVTSASLRAKSWEELLRLEPGFAEAMAQAASTRWGKPPGEEPEEAEAMHKCIGPVRIAGCEIPGWTCADFLSNWRAEMGEERPFDPCMNGLEAWPAKPFTSSLRVPHEVLQACDKANEYTRHWYTCVSEVQQECGDPNRLGKGKGGKGANPPSACRQPFATAVAELRSRLSEHPKFQNALAKLETFSEPGSTSYDLECLGCAAVEDFVVETVFGPSREVMYDAWLAERARQTDATMEG